MNNRLLKVVVIALVLVGSSVAASGQNYRRYGQWNERYWQRYDKNQVAQMIRNIETSANEFRSDFDRWLGRNNLDETTREDRFNSRVVAFEQATNQLRARFDQTDSWWETREDVQRVLQAARPVDFMMRRERLSQDVEFDWRRLRRHINRLASIYRLPQLGGYNNG